MAKLVNTPQFRKEMEALKLQSRQLSLESKKLAAHFNSPAFKQQIREAASAAKEAAECTEAAEHTGNHNEADCIEAQLY